MIVRFRRQRPVLTKLFRSGGHLFHGRGQNHLGGNGMDPDPLGKPEAIGSAEALYISKKDLQRNPGGQ